MRKKDGSLTYQVKRALSDKTAFGSSKHADKQAAAPDGRRVSDGHIYSYSTYNTYLQHCNYFARYCKTAHGCRTLAQCRGYVDEWVQSRIDAGLSPYTVKLEVSALAKLYGETCAGVCSVSTPSRVRADITRSRGDAVRDAHFSEEHNAELVEFCRATGLRRSELCGLRGTDLIRTETGYALAVRGGKGGRSRESPVVGTPEQVRAVVERCSEAGDGRVWPSVSGNADIHSYRAEYAERVYDAFKRPLSDLSRAGLYYCRGDQKGVVYDRDALLAASEALGHNRVSVVAEHYLGH